MRAVLLAGAWLRGWGQEVQGPDDVVHRNECAERWWRHCLGNPGRGICDVSGVAIPPSAGSWDPVLRQYTACSDGIWRGRYAEVQWDPELFRRFFKAITSAVDNLVLPSRFGLCYFIDFCTDLDLQSVVIPLFWLHVAHLGHIPVLSVLNDHVMQLMEAYYQRVKDNDSWFDAVGRPELLYGLYRKQFIYSMAMSERAEAAAEAAGPEARRPSGAFCIVGKPRKFVLPAVWQAMRRNLIDALNFTDSRNIYVLHLKATSFLQKTHHLLDGEPPRLDELTDGLAAIRPDILLTTPVDIEGDPPHRKCNATWVITCNAQFRSLELCFDQVQLLERHQGRKFDWIVRVRPDVYFNTSMGDILAYNSSAIHVRKASFTDVWDGFAMIPRHLAQTYFSTRKNGGASEYCWVASRGRNAMSSDCEHRLDAHLRRQRVPVERIPIGVFLGGGENGLRPEDYAGVPSRGPNDVRR